MIYTPYVIPLLAGAVILIGIGIYALQFRGMPVARVFILLEGLTALWLLFQAFEISSLSLDIKILMLQLRLLPNVFLAPTILALVLSYIGKKDWLTRRNLTLILFIPVIAVLLSLTNQYHHLIRTDFHLDTSGPFPVLMKSNTVGYWIYFTYTLILFMITFAILLAALHERTLSRRNTIYLFLGIFIPLIGEISFTFNITPVRGFDIVPLMLVFTNIVFTWVFLSSDGLNALPVAREIIMQHISDLVIVLDAKDHLVVFNQAAQGVFKFSMSLVGAKQDELPAQWQDFFQVYRQVKAFQGEIWLALPQGERCYDLNITSLQDKRMRYVGRLFLLHDLTQHRQAEEALLQSEEQYRLLSENSPLSIIVTALETGDVLYVNARAAESAGLTVGQVLGTKIVDYYVDPQDRDGLLHRLKTEVHVTDYEVRLKNGIGGEFWASLNANLVTFNGRPAIHTTFIDITRRKQAEEALKESNEKMELLFNLLPVGVSVHNREQRVVKVNPALERIMGISRAEFLSGDHLKREYFRPNGSQMPVSEFPSARIFEGEELVLHTEMGIEKEDKTLNWVDISAVACPFGDWGVVVVTTDITERKQFNEDLLIKERAFNSSIFAISISNLGGRLTYANPAFLRMWGYQRPEEVLGRRIVEFIPQKEKFNEIMISLTSGENWDGELIVEKKDGTPFDVQISSALVQDEHGRPICLLATFMDITQRKRAEEKLRQSEVHFRTLFEQAAVGVAITETLSGLYVRVNQKYCDFLGYTMEELFKMTYHDVTDPGDDVINTDYNARMMAGEITEFTMEKRYLHKDGRLVWGKLTVSPLWLPGEIPEKYMHVAIMEDITERKRAEQALRESEEKLQNVFKTIRDVIFVIDRNFRFITFNEPFLEMIGIEKQAGMAASELLASMNFPPHIAEYWRMQYSRAFAGEAFNVEGQFEQRDGIHYYENALSPMRDIDGNIYAILVVSRDITERKRVEAELVESQKMVGIGTLAAGIAHEINSPLQVITGYSGGLMEELKEHGKLEGERPERQLKTISRNAWRMAEIVRSLQHYAHPSREQANETNLNDLVKDTLILMEHQFKSWSNITIRTNLAEGLPPFYCDQNKIIQVLINLLSNARDAMPTGGTIKIDTAYNPKNQRLEMIIEDEGHGIPKAVLARIFDPFYTTKPVGKGTGLGLSIVLGIVRAHGGDIQVESVPKQGTTFYITFPLTLPTQQVESTLTAEHQPSRYD